MKPSKSSSWQDRHLVALGRVAVFYVPAHKMHDDDFGRAGKSAAQLFDEFFLREFGGFTFQESSIRGNWAPSKAQKRFTDLHVRYEVSFSGREKRDLLLHFLAAMCGQLRETSIYLTIGARAWLVKPANGASPAK